MACSSQRALRLSLPSMFGALLTVAGCSSCTKSTIPPKLSSIVPNTVPGNTRSQVTLGGENLALTTTIQVGEEKVSNIKVQMNQIVFDTPRLSRGQYKVSAQNEFGVSNSIFLTVTNSVPTVSVPGPQLIKAGESISIVIQASDFDADPLQFEALKLPPNSNFEPQTRRFSWQTSNADSGQYDVRIRVSDPSDSLEISFEIMVMSVLPSPTLDTVSPSEVRGNMEARLTVTGTNLTSGDVVVFEDSPLQTQIINRNVAEAVLPPQKRGVYQVQIQRDKLLTSKQPIEVLNSVPEILSPTSVNIDEYQALEMPITTQDFDGDPTRVFIRRLPPGASFNPETETVYFEPDFIQGGATYSLEMLVWDGEDVATSTMTIAVNDSVSPPSPTIRETESREDHVRIRLEQATDDFLEPAATSGRVYDARIVVPTQANVTNPLPVRVYLHGYGGGPYVGGRGDQFRIYPHDPDNTYWWGKKDGNSAPNFTQRRVLHLVEWVLKNYPGADPERVYVTGPSMGGAGATELGILNARHFALVEATIGQMIPRNHRPARVRQFTEHWGSPADNLDSGDGTGVWDQQDITLAFARSDESRNQFIFTRHGKDDPTIHFGAVVHSSPSTNKNYYQAIQFHKVGHLAVWDEGGHGPADPRLGSNWWSSGWDRIFDAQSFLRRDLAFPAFSNSSSDEDPGDGSSNGQQTWDETRGYAGTISVPADTGWNGDRAGAFNRYFRWDSSKIVDRWDQFEMPLKVQVSAEQVTTENGDPATGDQYTGSLPISANVTIRRVQAFRCKPGETITWVFGQNSGTVQADEFGTITIPSLRLTTNFQTLQLSRIMN